MFSLRASKKFGPFRFTASRSGFSMSAGGRNYRRTVSTTGRRTTTVRFGGWTRRSSKR
jgi:hypothetical protein